MFLLLQPKPVFKNRGFIVTKIFSIPPGIENMAYMANMANYFIMAHSTIQCIKIFSIPFNRIVTKEGVGLNLLNCAEQNPVH